MRVFACAVLHVVLRVVLCVAFVCVIVLRVPCCVHVMHVVFVCQL
jgi:hypothetical protein